MKELLGGVGGLLMLFSFLPYGIGILRRRVRPHAFTWILWALINAIVCAAQLSRGAGPGAIPPAVTAALNGLIGGAALFYGEKNNRNIIPSHRRKIADVSGAGDTVIAVASLVYACTKNIRLASEVANIAGGIVCEEVGTVAIKKETLLEECKRLLEAGAE